MSNKAEPELVALPFDPKSQAACPRCGAKLVGLSMGLLCTQGHLFKPTKAKRKKKGAE